MKRRVLAGIAIAVGLSMAGFGLAPKASAQVDPELAEAFVDNAPDVAVAAVNGIQTVVDTFVETQSTQDAWSAALAHLAHPTLAALVSDTDIEGLALLMALMFGFIWDPAGRHYLETVDDPGCVLASLDNPATVCTVFDADDIGTILGNLPRVPEALVEGDESGVGGGGLRTALIELLKGNLVEEGHQVPGNGHPAFVGDALGLNSTIVPPHGGVAGAGYTLLEDTTYAPLPIIAQNILTVAAAVAAGPLETVEEEGAPLFEEAEPATAPLIELLEGVSL